MGLCIANSVPAAETLAQTATENLKILSEFGKAFNASAVRELIKSGADVNVRNTNDITPLMMASHYGFAEVAGMLIEAGADVNVKVHIANKDYTPLAIAQQWKRTEIIKLLKEYGAKD